MKRKSRGEERWLGIRERQEREEREEGRGGDLGRRLNGMFMGDGSREMGGVRWKES